MRAALRYIAFALIVLAGGIQWTFWLQRERTITRAVEEFLKKTAIAYRQNLLLFLEFRWHAIAVFLKNASTSRVEAVWACGVEVVPLGKDAARYKPQ